jgi:hypothetical protein
MLFVQHPFLFYEFRNISIIIKLSLQIFIKYGCYYFTGPTEPIG